jgi:ATP-dependent DNA helicase RecG
MQTLNLQEGETIELKREWTDRALEDLAAFANTHGGILLLAQAFYYAGHIERWGMGTGRILTLCREQGLPEPEFDADALQFRVRFLKDPYTPERLRRMGLNERQVKAVRYAREHGSITNRQYRQIAGVSDEAARLDLKQLVELGIFRLQGKGRSTAYVLKRIGE